MISLEVVSQYSEVLQPGLQDDSPYYRCYLLPLLNHAFQTPYSRVGKKDAEGRKTEGAVLAPLFFIREFFAMKLVDQI